MKKISSLEVGQSFKFTEAGYAAIIRDYPHFGRFIPSKDSECRITYNQKRRLMFTCGGQEIEIPLPAEYEVMTSL